MTRWQADMIFFNSLLCITAFCYFTLFIKAKRKKNIGKAASLTAGFQILCRHYVLHRPAGKMHRLVCERYQNPTPVSPADLVTVSSRGPCEGRP